MNLHTVRSGGYAGLAFVVLVAASFLATGIMPDNAAAAATVSAYFDAHRIGVLVGGWLSLPTTVVFLWYSIGLYRWLLAAGNDEGLPLFTLLNGVLGSVLALVSGCLQIALAFHPSSALGPQEVTAFYDAFAITAAITLGLVAFFIFGASLSGLRHQSLPGWLCWFGYLFALGNLAASLTSMYNSGFMMLGGLGGLVLGLITFLLWMVVSAFFMIAKGAAAAAAAR